MTELHSLIPLSLHAPPTAPIRLNSSALAMALEAQLLELHPEPQQAILSFSVPSEFTQGARVVQGGVLAGMLDLAMACVGHITDRSTARPAEMLQVTFLRPAPQGMYTARASARREGRSMGFFTAQLEDESGRVVATASSTRSTAAPEAEE